MTNQDSNTLHREARRTCFHMARCSLILGVCAQLRMVLLPAWQKNYDVLLVHSVRLLLLKQWTISEVLKIGVAFQAHCTTFCVFEARDEERMY